MLSSASAERNCAPIVEQLLQLVPSLSTPHPPGATRHLLEVAAGSGIHTAAFAAALGDAWRIAPTDIDDACLTSIRLRTAECGNVLEPRRLDAVDAAAWAAIGAEFTPGAACVVSVNMLHISSRAALPGLVRGAASALAPGGALLVYGPFARRGVIAPDSNVRFDRSLRARNPEWGYRDTDEVAAEAAAAGLSMDEPIEMPANNLVLVLRKPR